MNIVILIFLVWLLVLLVAVSDLSFWLLFLIIFAGIVIGALWGRLSDARAKKILEREGKPRRFDWY